MTDLGDHKFQISHLRWSTARSQFKVGAFSFHRRLCWLWWWWCDRVEEKIKQKSHRSKIQFRVFMNHVERFNSIANACEQWVKVNKWSGCKFIDSSIDRSFQFISSIAIAHSHATTLTILALLSSSSSNHLFVSVHDDDSPTNWNYFLPNMIHDGIETVIKTFSNEQRSGEYHTRPVRSSLIKLLFVSQRSNLILMVLIWIQSSAKRPNESSSWWVMMWIKFDRSHQRSGHSFCDLL